MSVPSIQIQVVEELTNEQKEQVENLISASLVHINANYPFAYSFILSLHRIEDNSLESVFAVNDIQNKLFFNPTYIWHTFGLNEDISHQRREIVINDIIFILLHELGHFMLSHSSRTSSNFEHIIQAESISNEDQHKLTCWTEAMEYLANSFVKHYLRAKSPVILPPKFISEKFDMTEGMTTEECYLILLKEKDEQDSSATKGSSPTEVQINFPDGSSIKIDLKTQQEISSASQINSSRINSIVEDMQNTPGAGIGDLPNELKISLSSLKPPVITLPELLVNYIKAVSTPSDYSWKRPNKRYIQSGLYVPSLIGYEHTIIIAADTSGSVADDELARSWAEVIESFSSYPKNTKYHVISIDTEPHLFEDLCYEDLIGGENKYLYGRGGTEFSKAFNLVEEKFQDFDAFYFFTDGEVDYPEEPSFSDRLVWIIHRKNRNAPYGTTLCVEDYK